MTDATATPTNTVTTSEAAGEPASSAIPPRSDEARGSVAASEAEAKARTIAAADAAIKAAESQQQQAEGGEQQPPTAAPGEKTPPEPKTPAEKTKFAVTARAREQAQRTMEAADARARAVEEQARALEQKTKALDAEVERRANMAVQQRLSVLKKAPAKALAELGIKPEEFVQGFVQEPAPDPLADVREQLTSVQRELETRKQYEARVAAEADAARIEQAYAKSVLEAPEKYPALSARYAQAPTALAKEANRIAEAYHAKTGSYASWDDINEYLESQEREVLDRYTKSQASKQDAGQKQGPSKGQPPPQAERGTGPRSTLSTRTTSQRASANIPHHEMTPAQQREHLKAVAEEAAREARAKAAAQ